MAVYGCDYKQRYPSCQLGIRIVFFGLSRCLFRLFSYFRVYFVDFPRPVRPFFSPLYENLYCNFEHLYSTHIPILSPHYTDTGGIFTDSAVCMLYFFIFQRKSTRQSAPFSPASASLAPKWPPGPGRCPEHGSGAPALYTRRCPKWQLPPAHSRR